MSVVSGTKPSWGPVIPDIVGRDEESGLLRSALAAARRGRGSAVFLVGEAGLGKTRLLRDIAGAAGRSVVARGRATTPTAQFRALSEALSSVLRHGAVLDDADLAPYRSTLSRLVPAWRAHRVPGADDSPAVLAEAVLRLLRLLGADHGCLLALDDLHDADADTLAVVDYLVDNLAEEPVLLVGTLRPDPGPAVDLARAAGRRGVATGLELSHLADDDVRLLVAGCVGLDRADPTVVELARLVADGEGNPFYVEELLAEAIGGGPGRADLARGRGPGVPAAVLSSVASRADRLGPDGPRVLRAAAVFGRRFPAELVPGVAGVDEAVLLDVLRAAIGARLVVPVDGGYAFRHALTADALRAGLLPHEHAALAARAARVVEQAHPDLPDDWCLLAQRLWERAGDTTRAAELLATAGRRAAGHGGLGTAITLLERALDLGAPADPAPVLAPLLDALVAAGEVVRAADLGSRFTTRADPDAQAGVHLRLARAAAAAGRWEVGRRELDRARALPAVADPEFAVRADVVAAQLAFTDPAPGRLADAEALAGRALRGATRAGLPDAACEALEILGTCVRVRDLDEAESLFTRALDLADRHGLVLWRIRLLFDLGAHAGIRSGDPTALVAAHDAALTAGALVTALDIAAELAVVNLTRGDHAAAEKGAHDCAETARRLRLGDMTRTATGLRVCVSAHRGDRPTTMTLLDDYTRLGGADCDFTSALWGFGMAFCSLLEEDRPRAMAEFDLAAAAEADRPPQFVSYAHGPRVFLSVLSATAVDATAIRASASGQARWNRVFLAAADAVVAARDGRYREVERHLADFEAAAEPYPPARHLCLRLLAEPAAAGGWGDPARWLREAEAYFHAFPAPRVAAAARGLLRSAGESVRQRRRGTDAVPAELRLAGVTAREYDVLVLIGQRMTNREISERLFLSRRTIDTHVSNLLAKTGQPDRFAMIARYAEDLAPR
ncbi:AAA family ATPase [Actinokineospora auranticolor]|uniref:Regulatory LuxR family protein n=1 Tax=Actinokineospora auranticolor TaxID=155976 RepID=A0A2S6GIL0_9PSEU|nr:LuxR family transcriptional regulator [Actinokineospora auranticolor]PPK64996.1 regulatory LuxR family protein [Actinokineospora auranticolor]